MGRKVFVTYKYSDTFVKDLDLYEHSIWGVTKIQTRARHYVDKLSELLEKGDHIYKGEDDGQSLSDFSDEHIASTLRDKIYDSTITIVLISKGMKKLFTAEKDQWMPWEISYSLRESTRNGRTSSSNGIIAVVIPDEWNSYGYYVNHSYLCGCRMLNTDFLFNILKTNMFNQKEPSTSICSDGTTIYYGDNSFIQTVKWDDFIKGPNIYLDKAIAIRDNMSNYIINKSIE